MKNQVETAKPDELSITSGSAEETIFRITALSDKPPQAMKHERSNPHLLNQLTPFLSGLPNILASHEAGSSQYYKVVANGDLAQAKDIADGLRGWVIKDGKIDSHAILFEPEKLQNLVNFATAFNLASTLVGQKHLADISAKLDDIKQGVKQISDFQQNERLSKITYYASELESAASFLRTGERAPSLDHMLRNCESTLGPIQDHLEKDIDLFREEIRHHPLQEKQKPAFSKLLSEWRLCFEVRVTANYLGSLSHIEKEWSQAKMDKLKEKWGKHLQTLNEILTLLKMPQHAGGASLINTVKSAVAPGMAAKKQVANSLAHLGWLSDTEALIESCGQLVERCTYSAPGALTIEVCGDEVVAIHY